MSHIRRPGESRYPSTGASLRDLCIAMLTVWINALTTAQHRLFAGRAAGGRCAVAVCDFRCQGVSGKCLDGFDPYGVVGWFH
jgi:hypothetical protein